MSESTYQQRYAAGDSNTAGAFLFKTVGGKDAAVVGLTFGDSSTTTYVDATNPLPVTAGGAAHDAAVSGNPVLEGGYASAAAPASVSGDGDAVRAWFFRNGARAVEITSAGALIPGNATDGLLVNLGSNNDISGTVTANLSATDNAVLDNIDADTSAIQTAVELVDNVVYVDDADWTALTSSHALVGGIYQSTPGTITDGDTGPLRLDQNGRILVVPRAASAALGDDISNTVNQFVDASGAFTVQPVFPYVYDGTTWDRLRGTAADGMLVNLGSNNDVIQGTATSLKCEPDGHVAHDAADSGNPLKIGGKARTAHPTAVANGDRADLYMDDLGRPVVVSHPRDLITDQTTTITSSTAETTILTAAAATFHDITKIVVTNTSATPTELTVKQSTAGTTRIMLSAPANTSIEYLWPETMPQGAVNENWTGTCADSVASLVVYVQARKNV